MKKWEPEWIEVEKLAGPKTTREENTWAKNASKLLRRRLEDKAYVHALGAVTGNQAMQMVKAGLPAIYCSGWQVAADANDSNSMYPDQSLYPVSSVPTLVSKINGSLKRAAQIEWIEGFADLCDAESVDELEDEAGRYLCPVVADGEAGFGGPLNVFELTRAMIKAGAAATHWEDQLSSAKKCGHLGGKVLVPASEHIKKLKAARLAAHVVGVPEHIIIARTDANSARLLTSDVDELDLEFILQNSDNGGQSVYPERTAEGFFRITGGIDMAISRGLQYAPYADLLWCETSKPDLEEAKKFAETIKAEFPDQMLAYNCSPSFNWRKHLDPVTIGKFQKELGAMGYKFQFITLAGFHQLNYGMFDLAKSYELMDMTAYSDLQQKEFAEEEAGYTAHKHQREVGTGYFDLVATTIDKESSTTALKDSTEEEQF